MKDYGDVKYEVNHEISRTIPNMKGYEHTVPCAQEVSKKVCEIIQDGRICLTLGGDHSIGNLPSITILLWETINCE